MLINMIMSKNLTPDFTWQSLIKLTNKEAHQLHIEKFKKKQRDDCFGSGSDLGHKINDPTLWDLKCENDEDCPYYPNTFGACKKETGHCQWPIGIQSYSYRTPMNPEKAVCYNCQHGAVGKLTIGRCCQEQKNRKLMSPDYAYNQDLNQRSQFRQSFSNKGLNWFRYSELIKNKLDKLPRAFAD